VRAEGWRSKSEREGAFGNHRTDGGWMALFSSRYTWRLLEAGFHMEDWAQSSSTCKLGPNLGARKLGHSWQPIKYHPKFILR
jgi:hypothetical protein